MRHALIGLSAAVFLAGCGSLWGVEKVPEYHAVCVKPVEYTTEQQRQAATELEKIGPYSQLAAMMQDYGKQRAAERKCEKANEDH